MLNSNLLKHNKWEGYFNLKNHSFEAYLNLEITDRSNSEVEDWEECFGYPGVQLLMRRAEKVRIKYDTEKKYEGKEEEKGHFEARILQQGLDYL